MVSKKADRAHLAQEVKMEKEYLKEQKEVYKCCLGKELDEGSSHYDEFFLSRRIFLSSSLVY